MDELLEWIDLSNSVARIQKNWVGVCDSIPENSVAAIATFHDFCEVLQDALLLHEKMCTIREVISTHQGMIAPQWDDLQRVKSFREAIACGAIEEELNSVTSELETYKTILQGCAISQRANPTVAELLDAVLELDAEPYEKAYEENVKFTETKTALAERKALLDKLDVLSIIEPILSDFDNPTWDKRLESFEQAWNWARASEWVRRLTDPTTYKKLSGDLESLQSGVRDTLGKLSAAKAWHHTFERLTEQQRQHLVSWSMAVRRIGKGTGKHAEKHRRDARHHMDHCRSAIPAWIMPIYKVVETVKPGTDAFDVIIVDEASQSGPEALFLPYLGKQLVVVGDDKQISPEFVGFDRSSVRCASRAIFEGSAS